MTKKKIVCTICGKEGNRNSIYDAYACEFCDVWLETGCNDPKCEFCSTRPLKPSYCKEKK